jgi:hypothetical protein
MAHGLGEPTHLSIRQLCCRSANSFEALGGGWDGKPTGGKTAGVTGAALF